MVTLRLNANSAARPRLRGRRLPCLHRSSRTRSEGSRGSVSPGGLERRRWSRRKILDSDSTSLAMNAREVPSLSSFDRAPNGTKALHSSWHNLTVKAVKVTEVPSLLQQ